MILSLKHKKNEITQGTFNLDVFQLFMSPDKTKKVNSDPLNIPIFDKLGIHCIPYLGSYGDSYNFLEPLVLLIIPPQYLYEHLPLSLKDVIPINPLISHDFDFYVIIHSAPQRSPCQHFLCNHDNEINLMFHPWVYQGVKFGSKSFRILINMGLFEPNGVLPIHQNIPNQYDAGIPFGKMQKREVGIHGFSFSPCNAQILLNSQSSSFSFFSVASCDKIITNEQYLSDLAFPRTVVTYHILPGLDNLDIEAELSKTIKKSHDCSDLFLGLSNIGQDVFKIPLNGLRNLLLGNE